ncbi:MAG: LysR family transcriptional regulator [Rhodospirillaceae bacterium]|nr:LysR family transcriptional regulator [Rhodospirillaceae bacterium]
MNLTQLRAFHVVAQERSFTKAATAAHVSQPTLSGQVKALEETYRVRLFERRGRGVQLTELGQNLHALTQRLFAIEGEAQALLSGTRALQRGHLRVAADSAYHAIPILARLKARYGGLSFSLAIGSSAMVLKQLLDYEADVAVLAKLTSDPRLHSVQFRRDRLILFVPRGHGWAARKRIKLAELKDQEMVLRERGSITREVFEETLAGAAVKPSAIVEVQTREGVREAVAAGFGVGVVFESEFGADDRFHPLAVADADFAVAEYVLCLQERRRLALVRAFFDAAAEVAKEFRN